MAELGPAARLVERGGRRCGPATQGRDCGRPARPLLRFLLEGGASAATPPPPRLAACLIRASERSLQELLIAAPLVGVPR